MYNSFQWTRASRGRNLLTRHYEPIQPHLLVALAEKCRCDVFLDVGANVGAYCFFMTAVRSIKTLHAFEPSPETFAELRSNVGLNCVPIIIHNSAVSDEAGTLHFGIVNTLSGANSVIDTSIHQKFQRQIEVEAVRLDDLLSLKGEKLCIKIDVEGHESKALAGMHKLLAENEVVLQVEDYDKTNIAEMLEALSFKHLFRVGADRYFSNVTPALSNDDIIEVFQTASEALVQLSLADLKDIYKDGEAPLQIGITKSVGLHLRGRPASFLRSTRRRLRAVVGNPYL